jgi:dinuclear metal center YbgI/SA1388 family protein
VLTEVALLTVADIIRMIEAVAPPATAESWDNVGLHVGNPAQETSACLLTLDVSAETLGEARQCSAGLIVAHHPVIFAPLRAVTEAQPAGGLILLAARLGLSIYVAHTNLDAAPTVGTAPALAEHLGLGTGPVLEPLGGESAGHEEASAPGMGLVVDLPEMKLSALGQYIFARLGSPVRLVGDPERTVRRAALVPGSGGSLLEATSRVADVLITGELRYHDALYAQWLGVSAVVAGHYETERPVLNSLARYLKEASGGELQTPITQVRTDPYHPLP